jgi:hypothetical protein
MLIIALTILVTLAVVRPVSGLVRRTTGTTPHTFPHEVWVIIGTAVTAMFVLGGGVCAANLALAHHDHYRTVALAALQDGTGSTGVYLLGTGRTHTEAQYTFYWRDDSGALRLETIPADGVKLMDDATEPHAIQFTGCSLSHSWVAPCLWSDSRFVELHIPTGALHHPAELSPTPLLPTQE